MKVRLQKSSRMPLCAIFVFMIVITSSVIAPAQSHGYIVLHRFHGNDGSDPMAPLAVDSAGNIYGATTGGGDLNCNAPSGCGVVFKLKMTGGDFDLLHLFSGAPDGAFPAAGVILGAGKLYGTTQSGGGSCQPGGCGTVYQVAPTGQESVLYSFAGGPSDGAGPVGSLFMDAGQSLFGTTGSGGIQSVFGTAFELNASGAESVLHLFTQSPDGAIPVAGFVSDAAGNLFSTTALGGSQNSNCMGVGCGTVFELTPNGSGGWTESVVYAFQGGTDGLQPAGNLVKDASGNFYGVTVGGGNPSCGSFGCGTVFKLARTSTGWTESVLYSFTGGNDGANPRSVVMDSAGNLYVGTTSSGQYSHGTLFALSPSGQSTVLHQFTGKDDGATPQVGMVIEQPQRAIIGAASNGGMPGCGSLGCGVVFAYAP